MDDPVADLIVKCAAADRAAFRDLYHATSGKLFGTLLRILGERGQAEDALQEVYTGSGCARGGSTPPRAGA